VRWPGRSLEPWQRNQYIVLLTVAAANLGFNFYQPLLPLYVRYLGVTDVGEAALWSGLMVATTPLLSSSLAPVWGTLADRVGYRLLVLRALFGISLVAFLLGLAPNVYCFTPMAMALAVRAAPRDRVGTAVGLTQAAQLFPLAIGPPLGGLLSDRFDFRVNFFVAGAITFVAGVMLISLMRQEPGGLPVNPPDGKKPGLVAGLKSLALVPGFTATFAMLFLVQFVDRSLQPVLPLYLVEIQTPPDQLATVSGLIISTGAISAALASALIGRRAQAGGAKLLIAAGLAVGALAMAALPLASGWPEVLGLRLLLAMISGGAVSLAFALGARLVPSERTGVAIGVLTAGSGLGGAISPLLAGLLGSLSLSAVFLADAALYGLALITVLSLLGSYLRLLEARE
jgi:MFS transporter, DHA1 family, multidrug resistance protein